MNRLCPSEERLGEYVAGVISQKDRVHLEKHLAACHECRKLVSEAHDVIKMPDAGKIKRDAWGWIKNNRWLLGASLAFVFSFVFSEYFLQFLVGSFIMGGKWIIDSKTTKMLIMIHEAWKKGDNDTADNILSKIDKEKRTD